ncbi:regulatory protein YcgZ [Enterobacter hormaechei subsp. oharae]|uniref:regulatory protein YcgZ n=1 Tax=Enterobacter hormaechei TaxID=158836 RepID=UPI0022976017|nr:two-component-system connector protein YcgZ [Enterobacter hormaechei subsp. steigerwaltii]HCT9403399.1 two-component-system connector protein YcgZ [Enterobacter hormaechei]
MYQNTETGTQRALPLPLNQQEMLGEIVSEILRDGRNLNRKSLCVKLLSRLDKATSENEKNYYYKLINLLFG